VTIFDYLKDIVVTKHGNLPMDQYVPFLVNRWLSFINPTVGEMVNCTLNNKTLVENKELHYRTAISIFPKMKYCPKINYVKKVKEKEQDTDTRISILAQNLEISIREASFLVSCLD
jgi:hypothetical protein